MNASDIVAAITAGDLDGHLAEVVGAARERLIGQQTQRWRITYGDLVVTEDDLSLAEAVTVERAAGCGWGDLSPVDQASHTLAVVAAALHHRNGLALKAAREEVGRVPVPEAVSMIDFYEEG